MDWPIARTADGVLIVPGLKVWDYNYTQTEVTDRFRMCNGINDTQVPWFDTANGGMFDGSRLSVRKP